MRVVNRGLTIFDFFLQLSFPDYSNLVGLIGRAQLPAIVLSRRSGPPAPIRAVRNHSDAHDVVPDFWKPPWAERAPSKG
jgi:hypothetical protein